MRKCNMGDIVVLMHDSAGNFVPNFQCFIGAVGEVVNVKYSRPYVRFGTDDWNDCWYYDERQLFKVGTTLEV